MAFQYLFDFNTREVNNTNIVLRDLLLKATNIKLDKKKTLLNYKSLI